MKLEVSEELESGDTKHAGSSSFSQHKRIHRLLMSRDKISLGKRITSILRKRKEPIVERIDR